MDSCVQADRILLNQKFLLDERIHLLFEEVALVDIVGLKLDEVIVQIGDVLYDLLKDVVCGLCGVVLEGGALAPQQLHLLLVVIEILDGFLRISLLRRGNTRRLLKKSGLLTSSALI